jgi:hypothetical protein
MSTYLDIVGSVIIAGLLMLTFATFMGDRQVAVMNSSNQSTVQLQSDNAAEVLMSDLRKLGYMVATKPVLTCQPRAMIFLGDIDNNGSIDTVKYRMGGPVPSTPNPRDSLICRQVNNQLESQSDLGITNLRFVYVDASGNETTTASMVKSIQVRMTVQSRYPVDGVYQSISSDLRISPKNIK